MNPVSPNSSNADKPAQPATGIAKFTLAQVLSITTGRLCCEMGGLYEILNHITGDSLYTHALPRASRFAKPFLAQEHPELAIAETEAVDADLTRRIDEAKAIGGNIHGAIGAWLSMLGLPMLVEVRSHADAWMSIDPMAELIGMMGGSEKIIAVNSGESPEDVAQKVKRQLNP